MYLTPSAASASISDLMIGTMSHRNAEYVGYARSLSPRLYATAGNWLAVGSVILMPPGLCLRRKSASCFVRRFRCAIFATTTPVSGATAAPAEPAPLAVPLHVRETEPSLSSPSTDS